MTTTTTATNTWQWAVWEKKLALRVPAGQDLGINSNTPLLPEHDITFLCDECHAPITLPSIPLVDTAVLCSDCFRKRAGLLLNMNDTKTGFVLMEATI